jgi:anti-sigma B factor antagonist
MTVDYTCDEDMAFLTIAGDLDIASVSQLRDMVETACTDRTATLRLNLAGVEFIDSTGVGGLIGIKNDADNAHRVLIIEAPSDRVRRVLGLLGMSEHFQLE